MHLSGTIFVKIKLKNIKDILFPIQKKIVILSVIFLDI